MRDGIKVTSQKLCIILYFMTFISMSALQLKSQVMEKELLQKLIWKINYYRLFLIVSLEVSIV